MAAEVDRVDAAVTIYLDFDGVLHADGEAALDEQFRLIANPKLFCWRGQLDTLLAPYPAVRIIVSSDWRRLFGDDALVRLLGPLGGRFCGVVETFGGTRASEVESDASRRGISRWLALDDHPSVHDAARTDRRYIACDPQLGLSSSTPQEELARKLALLLIGDRA